MATATEVLRIAAREIGYSRWNDPQAGTKYGRWYAQGHGSYFGSNGVPFCAMFASWVFAQAGQRFPGMPAAYVPYILRDGRNAGREVPKASAQPGDLVIFNWDGGVVDHIGFVEINRGSYIQTIEGNTNNGRVARRTRGWSVVAAILRPDYNGASGGASPSGTLVVDGYAGPATIRRWQQVMGTPADGVVSGQVVPDGRTYGRPNLMSYGYGGYGSTLIRAVQKRVGVGVDGLMGPDTIRAIQRHLGVAADAWFGPATVKALQTRLNNNTF